MEVAHILVYPLLLRQCYYFVWRVFKYFYEEEGKVNNHEIYFLLLLPLLLLLPESLSKEEEDFASKSPWRNLLSRPLFSRFSYLLRCRQHWVKMRPKKIVVVVVVVTTWVSELTIGNLETEPKCSFNHSRNTGIKKERKKTTFVNKPADGWRLGLLEKFRK